MVCFCNDKGVSRLLSACCLESKRTCLWHERLLPDLNKGAVTMASSAPSALMIVFEKPGRDAQEWCPRQHLESLPAVAISLHG